MPYQIALFTTIVNGNPYSGFLLVNIGKLSDPNFDKIAKKFGIEKFPVIIITGSDGIASLDDASDLSTAY